MSTSPDVSELGEGLFLGGHNHRDLFTTISSLRFKLNQLLENLFFQTWVVFMAGFLLSSLGTFHSVPLWVCLLGRCTKEVKFVSNISCLRYSDRHWGYGCALNTVRGDWW